MQSDKEIVQYLEHLLDTHEIQNPYREWIVESMKNFLAQPMPEQPTPHRPTALLPLLRAMSQNISQLMDNHNLDCGNMNDALAAFEAEVKGGK